MLVLLVLVAIVGASLAVLLVAVFGPGPESSNGDPAAVISWTVALIGCIAAQIAGSSRLQPKSWDSFDNRT